MDNTLSGVAMGAALTTAGVYSPDIILSQFKFSDFTMLQTFLTAAAGSTLVVTLSQALGLTQLPPRSATSLGLLPTRYDGNLIGGALLGAGMAISGACPGTALAQLGVGVRSGRWAFGGAVLAGIVWAGIQRRQRQAAAAEKTKKQAAATDKDTTEPSLTTTTTTTKPCPSGPSLDTFLGTSKPAAATVLESTLLLALFALSRLTPATAALARGVPPYLGGLAIAAAQAISLVLRKTPIGASSAFEELGWYFYPGAARKYTHLLFSAGLVGGAWLAAQAFPTLRPVVEVAVSPVRSVVGGFLIVFGARIAGGCTSGHGISGLSLMSVSSFVTVAATFVAGGLVGLVLN
ncbi:hypothetical protein VTJ49DRAFT_2123 [Mycothermus thermophilus]|uniref:Sulphur transport domain-containing protein n=1 Tax=Humicola insolens TaxID=85995 RepID=A0ABR3VNB2_HUMIN